MYLIPAPAPDPTAAQVPPDRNAYHEGARIAAAAFKATKLWPGPVGKLIQRELESWQEFGFRLDREGLVARAVTDILDTPLPKAVA